MKKFIVNRIAIVATLLGFIMLAIFVATPFALRNRWAFAEDGAGDSYNPSDYWELGGEELEHFLDSHMSFNDVSDDYIEETELKAEETFGSYLTFTEEGAAVLVTQEFERQFEEDYSEVYKHFGNIYSPEYNFRELGEEGKALLEEEIYAYAGEEGVERIKFEVSTIRIINRNLSIMNRLEEEEIGYIGDDFEFYLYGDEEIQQLWSCWGVKFRWNKLSANFDSDWAQVFGFVILIYRLISFESDFMNALRSNQYRVEEIIKACGLS